MIRHRIHAPTSHAARPAAALLAAATLAWLAPALAAPPAAVPLSARDQAAIGAAACTDTPGTAHIGAAFRQAGTRTLRVVVRCQPHDTQAELPLARHTHCDNHTRTWRCDTPELAQLVTLQGGKPVAVLAHGVTPQVAAESVREAAKHTVPPFHKPAAWLLQGTCVVSPAAGLELAGATNHGIDCDAATLLLTRHCWRGGCRSFIARGIERSPPDPAR